MTVDPGVVAAHNGNQHKTCHEYRCRNACTIKQRHCVGKRNTDTYVYEKECLENEHYLFEEGLLVGLERLHLKMASAVQLAQKRKLKIRGITQHYAKRQRSNGATIAKRLGDTVDHKDKCRR